MKRSKIETQKYVLQTIGYKGATPQDVFCFTATDDEAAASKVRGWCRYQGMQYPNDATFVQATAKHDGYEIHNEWMSH